MNGLSAPAFGITTERLREGGPRPARALEKLAAAGALVAGTAAGDVSGVWDALVHWRYGLAETLAIPRLSDYGVGASDLDTIIEHAGTKNHPVPLDREDLWRILLERL